MQMVKHPVAARFGAPMSVLGFGCAAMLGRASRRESLAALHAAFESGITFYDNARSYGYGAAEGLLGEFLSEGRRREQVVLCTKFGIQPAARNWKQALKPVARAVLKLAPGLRGAVRKSAGDQFQPGRFTLADLQSSFETSLRELRTEYVDILLLHAAPATVLQQDDLLAALARLVEQGKVRVAGISGEQETIAATFAQRPRALETAQFAVNPKTLAFTRETERNADMLLVANHPFAGPAGVAELKARLAAMAADATLSPALREKLADGNDPQLFPETVFGLILSGTGIAAVLPAMMQTRHIRSNIAAVERWRFSADELEELRGRLIAG